MFDDHKPTTPAAGGSAPSNLPLGEAEDMFSGVDAAPPPPPPASPNPPEASEAPPVQQTVPETALGAGVLKPKTEQPLEPEPKAIPAPVQPAAPSIPLAPQPGADQSQPLPETYDIKEPTTSRGIIMIIIILVVIVILGGGGWFIYANIIKSNDTSDFGNVPSTQNPPAEQPGLISDTALDSNDSNSTGELTNKVIDDNLLFGKPVDQDNDELDDLREGQIGTNPIHWDTDGDGLSDGEEVIIWKTDPLSPDTDKDGYDDGAEVKAGYSPTGPGRLFEPPTATSTVTQ